MYSTLIHWYTNTLITACKSYNFAVSVCHYLKFSSCSTCFDSKRLISTSAPHRKLVLLYILVASLLKCSECYSLQNNSVAAVQFPNLPRAFETTFYYSPDSGHSYVNYRPCSLVRNPSQPTLLPVWLPDPPCWNAWNVPELRVEPQSLPSAWV